MTRSLFCVRLVAMINLSEETEALARRLTDAQSVTIEDAIKQALEASAHAAGVMLAEPARPRDRSPEAVAARRAHGSNRARDRGHADPRSASAARDHG